jgi:hypothetical protein
MNERDVSGLYAIVGLALALAFGFALWLIGADTLRTMAIILGACLGLALLIGAGALFVRAWKKSDNPPRVIEHHFHEGTRVIERHTIDGRQVEAPKLYQLPAPPSGGAFPDLLRAAYQAGTLRSRPDAPIEGEARELSAGEWDGYIRGSSPQGPQS